MRAYGGTAATCLPAAEKAPIITTIQAKLACNFSDLAVVQARLSAWPNVRILAEDFIATGAEISVALPEVEAPSIAKMITDLTSGRATVLLPD